MAYAGALKADEVEKMHKAYKILTADMIARNANMIKKMLASAQNVAIAA